MTWRQTYHPEKLYASSWCSRVRLESIAQSGCRSLSEGYQNGRVLSETVVAAVAGFAMLESVQLPGLLHSESPTMLEVRRRHLEEATSAHTVFGSDSGERTGIARVYGDIRESQGQEM